MSPIAFARMALVAVFVGLSPGSMAFAGLDIHINKITQRMTVTVDGVKRHTWKVSTGKIGYSTPSGNYRPFRMEKTHFSKEWDDAPMPHSIFFTYRGHAIHGSNQTRRLGRPASHGCVRLSPRNAARLYTLVSREGMGNTRITISGGGGGRISSELAPISREVKKIVPQVKRQFGDWLKETRGR